jgi:hypothetical protein
MRCVYLKILAGERRRVSSIERVARRSLRGYCLIAEVCEDFLSFLRFLASFVPVGGLLFVW